MKKYYIPTSSLNFNNILSSESLSPKAFYQKRSFGYKRWTAIPENPLENSIVLYDELCTFNRPASDVEDHPLLIEINLDEAIESTLSRYDDHIYLSDHTIFIDPFSTKLLFFTEKDKTVTLSLSDSSVETKFAHLYRNKICVITSPANKYPLIDDSSEKQVFNNAEVEKDKKTNRMKGLLYGYYIGGILSAHKEDVIRLNILREIRDILAAILASFDHQATERQKERLQYLYSRIQPEIPFFSKLKGLIPEDGPLFNAVVSLVREEYGYIRGELNADSIIKRLIATSTGNEVKDPVIEEIDHHIKQTESVIWQKSKPVLIEDEQIVVKDGRLVQIKTLSGTDKVLYLAWINDVLSKDEYTGKTSTFKDTLSDDVTIKSKEVYNDGEWKGSYPEITLNALRRHTRGENFEHKWINDVFSSISALIISGDDWTKLLQFMQSKEMTDYRIAFSMYGTINGFANLPRDFTDILLNRASRENYNERDSQYVAGVYKEFYKQLFGRDVVNSHNLNTKDKDNLSVYENEGGVAGSVSSIQLKMDASTNEFNSMMNELYLKCPGAKKDEPLYEDLFRRNGGLTEEFVDAVKREKTFKNGRGVQKGVKGALDKMLQQTIKAKNSIVSECIQNQTLFSDEEYKQQINLSTLPSLRCFQGLRKNVLERLNENWQYTSERHPDDKDEHINHFINLCLKEGKNNCSKRTSLKNVFNDSLAQEAKAELYDFYNVRKR